MERQLFENRLRFAVGHARRVANQMVTPGLPANTLFRVQLNMSADGADRRGDEKRYPAEAQPNGDLSLEGVVDLLWRDGWIPEWIDVAIVAATEVSAIAEARCCGRFTAGEELLYYRDRGTAPFGIKSPYLPFGWRSAEVDGRFALPRG